MLLIPCRHLSEQRQFRKQMGIIIPQRILRKALPAIFRRRHLPFQFQNPVIQSGQVFSVIQAGNRFQVRFPDKQSFLLFPRVKQLGKDILIFCPEG